MRRKYVRYITVVVFVCFCTTTQVYAGSTAPDWISGQLYITSTQPNQTKGCFNGTEKQTVKLVRKDATTDNKYVELVECVLHGKGFDLLYGVTYVGNTGIVGIYAIKLEGDDVFRYLRLQQYSYRIAEGTDKLFVYDSSYGQMHVLRGVASALVVSVSSSGGEVIEYTPNTRMDNGHHYWISGASEITIDPSGTYLVYAHYYDDTLAKINTVDDTQQFIQLNPRKLGTTPYVKAVSSDGRFVYINGIERIIDTDSCVTPDEVFFSVCKERDIGTPLMGYMGDNFAAGDAIFFDDNFSLRFIGIPRDYTHVTQEITVSLRVDISKLTYLALGDSYTSGEGDLEKDANGITHYLPLTDIGSDTCHISSRSYPFLLRDAWGVEPKNMHSVACSGSWLIKDYMADPQTYLGQGDRLSTHEDDLDTVRQTALEKYIPGRVPQIEFVKKYKPDIVTFTGGGNDVGFVDILTYCASSVESCGYVKGGYGSMHDDLMASIDDQYGYTKLFINKLKTASPGSQVYAIGYPKFVYEDAICGLNGALLDKKERQLINEAVDRLNAVIARAAKDTVTPYLDITTALSGGRICEGSAYVTDFLSGFLASQRLTDPNMFHPNAAGHAKMAESIIEAKNRVEQGVGTIVPTVPSVERTYKLYRQDITARDLVAGSTTIISTPDGMFAPNSGVSIGGQSEPVSIADVMADANGAIHWVGMLPRALAGGVHLLTATGYGTDGTPIQLQQFVTVFSSEAAKTNANMCDAIHHWYRDDGYDVCSNSAETVVSAPSSSKGKVAISTKNSTNLPQLSIESSSIAANSLSEKETTRGGSNVATTTITTSSSDTSVNFGTVIVITLGILGVVGILVMVVKFYGRANGR